MGRGETAEILLLTHHRRPLRVPHQGPSSQARDNRGQDVRSRSWVPALPSQSRKYFHGEAVCPALGKPTSRRRITHFSKNPSRIIIDGLVRPGSINAFVHLRYLLESWGKAWLGHGPALRPARSRGGFAKAITTWTFPSRNWFASPYGNEFVTSMALDLLEPCPLQTFL